MKYRSKFSFKILIFNPQYIMTLVLYSIQNKYQFDIYKYTKKIQRSYLQYKIYNT